MQEATKRPINWRREILDFVITLLIALAIALALRHWVIEPRSIPSGSMEPTLDVGDYVLTDKLLWKLRGLQRGQIVVFEPPQPSADPYIKRLIGLPGDTVEVRDEKVYVNGVALDEPYIAQKPNYKMAPVTVPVGHIFMMGDNRNNSNDSHMWGTASIDKVYGVAWLRFWPLGRWHHFQVPQYTGVPARS